MSFEVGTKECTAYYSSDPELLFIQPVSGDEERFLDEEIRSIVSSSKRNFAFISFHIDDWNNELSPWCAPPVFGNESFGDGASLTLR